MRPLWKTILFSACTNLLLLQPAMAADTSASAAARPHSLTLKLDDPAATVDGQTITLQTAPILLNETTMVPLRFVSESLGAEVKWDEATKSITLVNASQTIRLIVDQTSASVNGKATTLEHPPVIMNETTMVPLRFVAEAFDQTVNYDNATQTITIVGKPALEAPPPPAAAPTVPVKNPMDKPTVDNLTSPINKKLNLVPGVPGEGTARALDITADKDGNIFILFFDPKRLGGSEYVVLKYNEQYGDADLQQTAVSFNERFDVQNKETNRTYLASDLKPEKLVYDEASDKLYVLGALGTVDDDYVIYEALPSVQMIAHNSRSGVSNTSNFVASTGGGHLFYSDVFRKEIYDANGPSGKPTTFSYAFGSNVPKFVATVSQGHLYLFDRSNMVIVQVNPNGIRKVADVKMDPLVVSTAHDGIFYGATAQGIFRINMDGTVEPFIDLKDLVYNKGVFDPATGAYNPGFDSSHDPAPIIFGLSSLLTVDGKGNFIVYDSGTSNLRRINVYK